MKRTLHVTLAMSLLGLTANAFADLAVPIHFAIDNGQGQQIGSITLADSQYGLVLTPDLKALPPGMHGFHVHEKGNCASTTAEGKTVLAGSAGSHYDPDNTKKHATPWDDSGHRGDLPALYVDANGNATMPVLAPRLKLSEIKGRALMIHAGADNHSDHPAPLGGGAGRIACGVIPN